MLSFNRRNPTELCFFLGDWWFFGPTSFGFAAVCYKLFLELSRVQDRINMSKEIVSASLVWFCTASECYSYRMRIADGARV